VKQIIGQIRRSLNFRFSLYLLIGLAALVMTVAQGSIYFSLFVFVCFTACWYIEKKDANIEEGVASWLTVAGFIGAVVEYFIIYDFIKSMSHFLVYVTIIKLLQKKKQRDYGLLMLISLINIMVAAILTVKMYYLPFLLFYALLAAYVLIVFQDKRTREDIQEEMERKGSVGKALYIKRPLGGFSSTLVTIFSLGLPMVFLTFVFFPRFTAAIWHARVTKTPVPAVLVTGFSEEVELDDIGQILEKTDPVMAVSLYKDDKPYIPKDDLYWRGISFQNYDGSAWEEFQDGRGRGRYYSTEKVPLSLIRRLPNCPVEDITQEVILQPLDSRIVFSLYAPIRFESTALHSIEYCETSEVLTTAHDRWFPLKYKVVSRIPRPLEEDLRSAPSNYPMHIVRQYLPLPEQISPRVYALAREAAPDDKYPTPFDKARAIEMFLSANYHYTFNIRHSLDVEPVEDFLFNLKEGHCEYFASAMVVLLRSLGVPCRLVNGFRNGEWNRLGDSYLIRQNDAHSWVEVYFPDIGWITFDPSPLMGSPALPGPSLPWIGNFRQLLDLLEIRWYSYIIGYEEYQAKVYKAVERASNALGRRILGGRLRRGRFLIGGRRITPLGASWTGPLITVIGLSLLTAAVLFVLFFRWAIMRPFIIVFKFFKSHATVYLPYPQVKFYRQLLLILSRKGFKREPTFTPMEFARHIISRAGETLRPVSEITEAFYRVRFGRENLKKEEMSRIRELLRYLARLKIPSF